MRNTKRRAAASEGCTRGGRSAAGAKTAYSEGQDERVAAATCGEPG